MKTIIKYTIIISLVFAGFNCIAQFEKRSYEKSHGKDIIELKKSVIIQPEYLLLNKVIILNTANMECKFYIDNVLCTLNYNYQLEFKDLKRDLNIKIYNANGKNKEYKLPKSKKYHLVWDSDEQIVDIKTVNGT